MMLKQKNQAVDTLKGLGIVFVVYGHLIPSSHPIFKYVFSFHMPLFFFISGYCYTMRLAERKIFDYITSRFFKLLIPCWIYVNLFFLIRLGWNGFWAVKQQNYLQYIVPEEEWFLPSSFIGGVLLLCIVKIRKAISSKSEAVGKVFMIAMLILAVYFGIFFPANNPGIYDGFHRFAFFRLDHVFVALSFFILGFMIRNDLPELSSITLEYKRIIIILIIGAISVYYSQNTGYINLCDRSYGSSVMLFYFFALFGISVWALISVLINKHTRILKRILTYLGKNSLWIYILQGLLIISEPYILGIVYNRFAKLIGIWTWDELHSHNPEVPAIIYCVFILLISSILLLCKDRIILFLSNLKKKQIHS